jgi:hypothetical protein
MEKLCVAIEQDFKAHYGISDQADKTVAQEIHAHAQA